MTQTGYLREIFIKKIHLKQVKWGYSENFFLVAFFNKVFDGDSGFDVSYSPVFESVHIA